MRRGGGVTEEFQSQFEIAGRGLLGDGFVQ